MLQAEPCRLYFMFDMFAIDLKFLDHFESLTLKYIATVSKYIIIIYYRVI